MGFWSRLFGSKEDKFSAHDKRKELGDQLAKADTKVWAIEDRLKDSRTTKQQRQDLLDALPHAKERARVLSEQWEEAKRQEYAESVKKTLEY